MSAYMVSNTHIDALLTAGLADPSDNLRWIWPTIVEPTAFQEGEPWGPEAVELARERIHKLTRANATQVGAMLLNENRLSVNHRYAEDELEEVYVFDELTGIVKWGDVVNAVTCLEYQSCEHPGWRTSEAYAFCDALYRRAVSNLTEVRSSKVRDIDDRKVWGNSISLMSMIEKGKR